jgi:hypothetical protein
MESGRKFRGIEGAMIAYLLLLVAVLSRLLLVAGGLPMHAGWMNFTAVGGVLLYFGARRSWREMATPLVVLMATDYFLTTRVYHFSFEWQFYVPTWIWYIAAMALGQILLRTRTSFVRVASGALLGPTSFFLISNYAVWASTAMYPKNLGGLGLCYVAGLPFYRNDLFSTALVAAVLFGAPVLVRQMRAMGKHAEAKI